MLSPAVEGTRKPLASRAGQRDDYPRKGEWRWLAGWIRPRPTDLGWIRPSDVINAQRMPEGGFRAPEGGLFEVWGIELALVSAYVLSGAGVLVSAVKRRKTGIVLVAAGLCLAAGGYLGHRGLQLNWVVYLVAAVLAVTWIFTRLRARTSG